MSLEDFLTDLDGQIETINSSEFEIEVIETDYVPSFSDPNITYDNLDTKKKKCKRIETCVLYVDMRNSARISSEKKPKTLAKVYASFAQSMIECARYYGGHVRNIIGDRIMVVFDKDNCFKNAVNTAVLMNTVCKHILDRRIEGFDFKAGIGIDYGKMLVTKVGKIRRGDEKEFYRSLVWLGKPANVASRFTDLAVKTVYKNIPTVEEGNYYPLTRKWLWVTQSEGDFISRLEVTNSRYLKHKEEYFCTWIRSSKISSVTPPPILFSKAVYDGAKKQMSNDKAFAENWWRKQSLDVRDFDGEVYGGDVHFVSSLS